MVAEMLSKSEYMGKYPPNMNEKLLLYIFNLHDWHKFTFILGVRTGDAGR